MPVMQLVENWPMESYPWRPGWQGNRKGLIYTTHWKFEFRKRDGTMDFKTWKGYMAEKDERGKNIEVEVEVPYQQKVAIVNRPIKPFIEPGDGVEAEDPEYTGWMSFIPPKDIRMAENEIGGKPTGVLAGLWAKWDGQQWVEIDMEKIHVPLFWVDMTEIYYKLMRAAAYEKAFDPYQDQERPFTRIQELEMKFKEANDPLLSKQLSDAKAKIAELDAKLAETAAKNK